MVYCGKASQGCQGCRTRRIKCDKVRPECTQCVRVNKKCPGYRDQLSLMFRDESSKVMQKAHAQWGTQESPDASSTTTFISFNSPQSQSVSLPSPDRPRSEPQPAKEKPAQPAAVHVQLTSGPALSARRASTADRHLSKGTEAAAPALAKIPSILHTPIEDRGVQFYVNRYLIGHPDEVQSQEDLESPANSWIWHPDLQDIMSAIGMAALANLSADVDMMNVARQKYGKALHCTGRLILQKSPTEDNFVSTRSVILLAMFELVKGPHRSNGPAASAHVMGGAVMLRNKIAAQQIYPPPRQSGFRALIQMLCSMFLTMHTRGLPLPQNMVDAIRFSHRIASPEDAPSTALASSIAKFVQVSSVVSGQVLSDGRPKTSLVIQQLLGLDAELAAWEEGLDEQWRYRIVTNPKLPARAVFHGRYHIYYDRWIAHMWNFYRWSRITANQLLINMIDQFPTSSLPLVSAVRRDAALDTIFRLAEDLLTSAPSHWRHPLMEDENLVMVDHGRGGAYGGAGVPLLLSQLRAAACAPGVPIEYWEWATELVHCIWSDSGMLHARSMLDAMRSHQEMLQKIEPEGILLHDE